jgi:hypothetical protein
MKRARLNHFLKGDVPLAKYDSTQSPSKRKTFLSLVTPSKSREKQNQTQATIKLGLNLSIERSLDGMP